MDDEVLVEGAANEEVPPHVDDDDEWVARLAAEHGPWIVRKLRRAGCNDPEGVLQDALIEALRQARAGRRLEPNPAGWLYMVALRKQSAAWKKSRREVPRDDIEIPDDCNPLDRVLAEEGRHRLGASLRTVLRTEKPADVDALCQQADGVKLATVARSRGVSGVSVRKSVSRLCERVRPQLEDVRDLLRGVPVPLRVRIRRLPIACGDALAAAILVGTAALASSPTAPPVGGIRVDVDPTITVTAPTAPALPDVRADGRATVQSPTVLPSLSPPPAPATWVADVTGSYTATCDEIGSEAVAPNVRYSHLLCWADLRSDTCDEDPDVARTTECSLRLSGVYVYEDGVTTVLGSRSTFACDPDRDLGGGLLSSGGRGVLDGEYVGHVSGTFTEASIDDVNGVVRNVIVEAGGDGIRATVVLTMPCTLGRLTGSFSGTVGSA